MDFNEYQETARRTAVYPNLGNNLWYPALGLVGETGEVVGIIKKIYRDHGGNVSFENQVGLRKELGDALWYIANTASEASLTLNEIAVGNIAKLADRLARGVLHGSGDNR